MKVKIKIMENGKLPMYQRKGDTCLDCYCAESIVRIEPKTRKLIKLGFALELPMGYEAIIRPRSGLSSRGIDISIGTIDTNYRGEVMANVSNTTEETKIFNFGDRICQLAIRKSEEIEWEQVEELSESERNDKGFGSTGL